MRTKQWSREVKRAAIELWRAGIKQTDIVLRLSMPVRTVQRLIAADRRNAASGVPAFIPDRKQKEGTHNRKVFPNALAKMKKLLEKEPSLTGKQLKLRILELEGVAVRTIQYHCNKTLKLPARRMAKKPLLNRRMMDQRLDFAQQYQHWTVDDWKKVMFSDESHFELRFGRQSSFCRRSKGSDRYDPLFTKKTVKHPPKVMVWGSFSYGRSGGIEFMGKGEMMTGERYLRLLDEKLEEKMEEHGCDHFLQDSAPCHKAKVVTKWFLERPHITLIKWPGNSPDLNPIENCWIWMKKQLREENNTSVPMLEASIARLWEEKMGDCQYLEALVNSMPRRMADVIERDGNMTKY